MSKTSPYHRTQAAILVQLLCLVIVFICPMLHVNAQVKSPIIHSDGSVTLNFTIPKADEVVVCGDIPSRGVKLNTGFGSIRFHRDINMKKMNDTLWTYTTAALKPDMYLYYYEVDGEEDGDSLDVRNPNVVRDIDKKFNFFIVPGDTANYYLDTQVPHGRVHKLWHPSSIELTPNRRMTLYTPPGYEADSIRRYPVLYLLHGSGGDEDSWQECGRVMQILDNMLAKGEIEPMIVVMPNGDVTADAAPGERIHFEESEPSHTAPTQYGLFEASFMHDVVGYVDAHYRTIADKKYRAIAGLSLGGFHTLYITANNPDSFDYIGLFSPQIKPNGNPFAKAGIRIAGSFVSQFRRIRSSFRDNESEERNSLIDKKRGLNQYDNIEGKMNDLFAFQPKLYYIAVGKDDFVQYPVDVFSQELSKKSYNHIYRKTEGGHTWNNWRRYLVDFLPKLFVNPKQSL